MSAQACLHRLSYTPACQGILSEQLVRLSHWLLTKELAHYSKCKPRSVDHSQSALHLTFHWCLKSFDLVLQPLYGSVFRV